MPCQSFNVTHAQTTLIEIVSTFRSVDNSKLTSKEQSLVESCILGDVGALYNMSILLVQQKIALFEHDKNLPVALKVLHHLADEMEHVKAQFTLARVYTVGIDPHLRKSTSNALRYYQLAGDQGHHSSLYNAGYILATGIVTNENTSYINSSDDDIVPKDLVASFAYLHAAATLHLKYPEDSEPHITEASKMALSTLIKSIPDLTISIRELADLFIFGTYHETSDNVRQLWIDAVTALIEFNATFVDTNGRKQDEMQMRKAVEALKVILTDHKKELSELQEYLVLDNLNDMIGPLAAKGGEFILEAGNYAEALALTKLCYDRYAVTEKDPACFNGAASSAVSFYRRMGDFTSAERVRILANNHPHASTHWWTILQTPRVFHPDLKSKPWWNASEFSAARKLKTSYENNISRNMMLNEINNVISLYEGDLRGAEVVVSSEDGSTQLKNSSAGGLQRIFTPYIGVQTRDDEIQERGAGGWAEFGPLFDGHHWSKERCEIVPTICRILEHDESLCSSFRKLSSHPFSRTVSGWDLCGSGTIVTILRLRPGTSILPHCGTTNSRLIMHFPIIGAEGVRFIVGDETVVSYGEGDGHPIVFDDSYEHHVYHEGLKDRFIVLAVLGHPESRKVVH